LRGRGPCRRVCRNERLEEAVAHFLGKSRPAVGDRDLYRFIVEQCRRYREFTPSAPGHRFERVGLVAIAPALLRAVWSTGTLYGPAARVREGVEQWREAGITTPVLVPLSPDGNQMNGLKAVFAAFER
jgi:hypothetical protein